MAPQNPGLLYVPLHQGSLTDAQLNNWYNNQHTPSRMCYPFFSNGYRYKQVLDISKTQRDMTLVQQIPNKLALYDISDMNELYQAPYNILLEPNMQGLRDRDCLSKVTASRKYFDHVATYSSIGYEEEKLLHGGNNTLATGVLIIVHVRLTSNSSETEAEFKRWYEEDHIPPLRKVPGWLRTRIYRTSFVESRSGEIEYVTLSEFEDSEQVGGPEHQIAIRTESKTNVVASKRREYWKLEIVLGSGPKDLTSLAALKADEADYASPDGFIRTANESWPTIESSVSIGNAGVVEYRLEGRGSQMSEILALGTVSGLHWDVWDQLVSSILKEKVDVRVLRVKLSMTSQLRNLPITSGAAFLQLGVRVTAVLSELLLPPAVLVLGLGMAGETIDRRFESYCIHNWMRLEPQQSTGSIASTLRFAVIAKNRMSREAALEQLLSMLVRSETIAQWSRNILQELAGRTTEFRE